MIGVLPITYQDALPWLLNKHYARRSAPVTYAFGAYEDGALIGIVTYGTPLSSTLKVGVCGNEWAGHVLELNRLCCDSRKNLASLLVGRSLQALPKPSVVVSYADTGVGHVGYVYQATNFLYTGLSARVMEYAVDGLDLHSASIGDKVRGVKNRANALREMYGEAFHMKERTRKHRYVFFVGNRWQVKEMRLALKYEVQPYPKGDTKRYDAGGDVTTQLVML
jgi:hypothetical protein